MSDCPFHGTALLVGGCGHCRKAYAMRRASDYGREYKAKRRAEMVASRAKRAAYDLDRPTSYVDHPETSVAEDVLEIMKTIKREFR